MNQDNSDPLGRPAFINMVGEIFLFKHKKWDSFNRTKRSIETDFMNRHQRSELAYSLCIIEALIEARIDVRDFLRGVHLRSMHLGKIVDTDSACGTNSGAQVTPFTVFVKNRRSV